MDERLKMINTPIEEGKRISSYIMNIEDEQREIECIINEITKQINGYSPGGIGINQQEDEEVIGYLGRLKNISTINKQLIKKLVSIIETL